MPDSKVTEEKKDDATPPKPKYIMDTERFIKIWAANLTKKKKDLKEKQTSFSVFIDDLKTEFDSENMGAEINENTVVSKQNTLLKNIGLKSSAIIKPPAGSRKKDWSSKKTSFPEKVRKGE